MNHRTRDQLRAKSQKSRDSDPCRKEAEISLDCLTEYEGSQEICQKQIFNYSTCKSFWSSVQEYRRQRDIRPFLPPPEERVKYKEEFFEKVRSGLQANPPSPK